MASPSKDFCTLCKKNNVSSDAVTWCTECEVFLCDECEKHHKRYKTSKDHKTILVENYHGLPSFIKGTINLCKIHDKKFELYCSVHSCACCVHCVTDEHQSCQTMEPLYKILKQIKSSAAVALLEKDLKGMKENYEEIIEYLKNRIVTNAKQKKQETEHVRSVRKSLDDYLNQLEQQLLKDIEIEESKLNSKIKTILHDIDKRATQIGKLIYEFSNMTKYATELQTYVGLREIEKITSKGGNFIDNLKSGFDLNERNLRVETSPALNSILHDVKSFGKVSVETRPCNVLANAGRRDQAQYLVSIPTLNEIKVTPLTILSVPKETKFRFIDCCILPCGDLIALGDTDSNSNLKMFKNDGSFVRTIVSLRDAPQSMCFIKDDTVAVTLYKAYKAVLVDVKKNEVGRCINFYDACYGVASDGDVLLTSMALTKRIIKVNLQDDSKQNLEGIDVYKISFFKGNIYGANFMSNIVNCYKLSGEMLWSFKHNDINEPVGIALDKHGFVYVACRKSNRIVVVSSDGKSCRTILNHDNGIVAPYAVTIDVTSGIMLVLGGSQRQDSLLFKL